MRRTRLRWMYLPRIKKKSEKEHPMQVQNSEDFLKTALTLATVTCIAAFIMTLRQVQVRKRRSGQEVLLKRSGQKVVIIGAGPGGCATAASLTNASPDLHVTVIEKDRQHTFLGQVPLAHVGHRSYDLGTTTGMDVERSPASWNVTREADLVAAEVLRVDPAAKRVFVRTSTPMLNAAKPLTEAEEKAAAAAAPGVLARWLPWTRASAAANPVTISINADGSHNLSDGTTVFAYDALVVAAGAQRSTGHLHGMLQPHQLDSYRIAVNPGTTRDSLTSMFAGNVVHVKVPPASFVWQMEAARKLMGKGSPCATVDVTKDGHNPSSQASSTAALPTGVNSVAATTHETSWEDATLVTRLRATVREQWTAFRDRPSAVAASGTDDAIIPDEVALRLQSVSTATPSACSSPPSSSPLALLSSWCMRFSSRQHDSTFVSSTNTIWRFLFYYSKLSHCPLFAVTADEQPIATAPPQLNHAIEKFWRERQLRCRVGDSDADGNHFHVLYHAYVTAIDTLANIVTLYDYKNNAELRVPFALLVLDLPLRAPGFVRRSGLHRTRYIDECVRPALAEGEKAAAESAAAAAALPSVKALQRAPLLGMGTAELEAVFSDESSFMDVDPNTLQHRRFRDVFAIGDVAGLPSVKGYGAVYAQVPVVAHNVRQVLNAQKIEAAAASAERPTAESSAVVPRANARYTGYSSFHVVMTTWRAMWPEMEYAYDATDTTAMDATTEVSACAAEARSKARCDIVAPLRHYDHHLWNNLAWRDPRGFFNALYYQSSLYEIMFYFAFSRAQWHSPTWFAVPSFSVEDGTRHVPSLRDLL